MTRVSHKPSWNAIFNIPFGWKFIGPDFFLLFESFFHEAVISNIDWIISIRRVSFTKLQLCKSPLPSFRLPSFDSVIHRLLAGGLIQAEQNPVWTRLTRKLITHGWESKLRPKTSWVIRWVLLRHPVWVNETWMLTEGIKWGVAFFLNPFSEITGSDLAWTPSSYLVPSRKGKERSPSVPNWAGEVWKGVSMVT